MAPRGWDGHRGPRRPPSRPSPNYQSFSSQSPAPSFNITPANMPLQTHGHVSSNDEYKVRLSGLPMGCWTNQIYEELSNHGDIIRIEMMSGNQAPTAFVTFHKTPKSGSSLHKGKIKVLGSLVNVVPANAIPMEVESPIDDKKKYPQFTVLSGSSIDFGARTSDSSIMIMKSINTPGSTSMTLNLRRKEIDIKFSLAVTCEARWYRFRMPIAQLENIYQVHNATTGQIELVIPFEKPTQFFRKATKKTILNTFNPSDRTWNEWNAWYRQTDVVDRKVYEGMIQEPLKNHKDTAFIDIGRWTTYRFSFDSSKLNSARWAIMRNALSDHNIDIVARTDLVFQPKRVAPIWNLLQDEFSSYHSGNEENQSAFEDLAADQCSLAFPVRYQLEACLTNGYLKEHSITSSFLNRLAQLEVDHATRILEKIADRQQVLYNPDQVFQIHVKGKMSRNVPTYCTLSRSVTITPTMLHVNTPVVETSNRITRKHAADADRFIRVKFTDEKTEGRLGSQTDDRSNAVFNRISRAMERGVIVAGRHYVFLAFGNSQFREHGAYFYAPTSSTSAENIRSTMGCFDHIKVVAKKGARIGQCLSTTRSIHVVNDIKVEEIADIERNGYTFSDGVGKLSRFLAQMSAQQLGIHNAFDDPPSLFQFRMDGCKGVLVLDPALKNNIVQIRPSQKKFTTTKKGLLEIIRASAFATACFNRQLIIILSTLGVSDEIFIRKQQEMVNSLERATIEETIAIKKLQQNIDYNGSTLKMVAMILDGFMKAKEPFMMSLLQLWRAYNIKYLKEKARIMIEEGAFVLGCIDETATLKGHFDEPQCRSTATRNEKLGTLPEIFLQITDPTSKSQYKVIEGVCVLARNPSLHAGDVRVVRAVDVPALHHLRNVVVLPQTGDRDVANMCSGGDLDGDDYLVLWDKEFIPKSINEVPMDFTPEKPQELDREVTIKDISDFFVTYIKNDSLARIALAHLAQADINEEGVRDETCIQLAQLHSQAVDYPKSGIPAIMDRGLKPRRYPHFMESKYRTKDQVYRSKKILGRLFDEVELVGFKPQYENKFDARILEAFELDKAWLAKAASIKDAYDESMKRLMAKHAIRTEFEAWVVFVLSHNQESRDYTFAEDFGRSVDLLKTQYKEICINASKEGSGLPRFVAAMYTVTAQQVTDAVEECQHTVIVDGREEKREMTSETMPLMSFPWLFASELVRLPLKVGRRSDMLDN